jgi:hypothetical protein
MQFRSDLRLPLPAAMGIALRGGAYPPECDICVRIAKGQRIISVYPPAKTKVADPAFT